MQNDEQEALERTTAEKGEAAPSLFRPKMLYPVLGLLLASLFLAYKGVGEPNHYYQPVLALLTVALLYDRKVIVLPEGLMRFAIIPLNFAALTFVYKLLVGGGKKFPLHWLFYPVLKDRVENEGILPDFALTWEPTPVAAWSIDFTVLQTFLVLLTVLCALVDFQPFASFTALALIVVSLPALFTFNWSWVFPALLCAAVAFYLQSPTRAKSE